MRIALYARVSTHDKDQDPDTQLYRLRDFTHSKSGWKIVKEYVDVASATDLGHRTSWRRLLDDAVKRKFDAVLVFRLDRAFRSVKHMHDTLAVWEPLGVGFLSAQEGFETTTPLGRILLNLLASLAEFELEMIRERVKAGMERAQKQGRTVGRPSAVSDPQTQERWARAYPQIKAGTMSIRKAATVVGVGTATIYRMLEQASRNGGAPEGP